MIIDSHLHVFPDALAYRAVTVLSENSGLTAYTDGTVHDTVEKLDANGIDIAVALNIAKKPNQDGKVNDFAISANSDRLIHFGSVNPYSDNIENELERLKRSGIKGIKLHPEYQCFQVDDKKADVIYRKCAEFDLIVAIHAGWDVAYPNSDNANPIYLRNIVDKFPDTTFQMAHFGGMLKWEIVEEYLAGSHCYMDISMCGRFLDIGSARRIIEKHGIDNFLFGSDCPWESWEIMKDFVARLELNEIEYNKVMWQNAAKLLKLDL